MDRESAGTLLGRGRLWESQGEVSPVGVVPQSLCAHIHPPGEQGG